MLDPNSFSFNNLINAPPMGYYTPTPGGNNTLFHSQAGDLHTPNLGAGPGLATPLSMPTSCDSLPSGAGVVDMSGFQTLPPHQLHHFNPFVHLPPSEPAFAPSTFVHHDTGYETMDHDGSPLDSDHSEGRVNAIDSAFQNNSPTTSFQPGHFPGTPLNHVMSHSEEKFRFHSTLNAPTAMTKHAEEIPITYLNKGQAYSLSVVDTNAAAPLVPGTKYRTFVRIYFEDEQQRMRPGVCWSLWKEGRGTSEAHQRGRNLRAVEFLEAGHPADENDKKSRVEMESCSFDGFSVVWTPGANHSPEVNIAVRFNFLSTDFSHSKGVKGVPVRLCAKTCQVSPERAQFTPDPGAEICYCKVKLFRDHGAERKLTNDVAHAKKSIDKLKQQLAQLESGMKDFGKRKRPGGAGQAADMQRPGKAPKHKRTWSMSSTSSASGNAGGPMTIEDDLHFKLQTLQDMFSSTRPVSVLYLRGEELDDPDLHPVSMRGDASPSATADGLQDGNNWQARSTHSSSITTASHASQSPSSQSLASQASAIGQGGQWQNYDGNANAERKGSDQPTRIAKTDDDRTLSRWIEALGVDQSYKPPPDRRGQKPVACFYIVRRDEAELGRPTYHRAVYLFERTLKELNTRIAAKWGLDSSQVQRTVHVIKDGLEVELDDDVVRELKEGQDMELEVRDIIDQPMPAKREWEMSMDFKLDKDETLQQAPLPAKSGISLCLMF